MIPKDTPMTSLELFALALIRHGAEVEADEPSGMRLRVKVLPRSSISSLEWYIVLARDYQGFFSFAQFNEEGKTSYGWKSMPPATREWFLRRIGIDPHKPLDNTRPGTI